MKCFVCKKELPEYGAILLGCDGDFVCSKKCNQKYEDDKKHFFDNVINDDKKFNKWMNE